MHLARWRGHALARFADPDATKVLTEALDRIDPSFVRGEISLRVDVVTSYGPGGDQVEARTHGDQARALAEQLGSLHQRRRLETPGASLR